MPSHLFGTSETRYVEARPSISTPFGSGAPVSYTLDGGVATGGDDVGFQLAELSRFQTRVLEHIKQEEVERVIQEGKDPGWDARHYDLHRVSAINGTQRL